MTLAAGTRIGPYEIVEKIGSGGMGEVYRATDTKLGRDVAIKTLPVALAQEPDRLARFEREARLLATVNHAHIAAIYDLDEHEGTQLIAMELIEGQTLGERLEDGPLPIEDALQIALQIAEALEAAHAKGIVHRDLKPANIMLTPNGVVKVLDFGLAKAFAGDPNQASPAHSPALSLAMTQQGLILGTAGYMSPEQASGQATDQRADVWAFGVLLYEMLAGLPPFSGESVPHILADILRTEPDWTRLPENLHPRLRLLLERCLEKKVRNRYHAIADARVDIEKALSDPLGLTQTAAFAQPTQPAWRRALPTTALVAVAVGITAVAVWLGTRPGPPPINRFDHDIPINLTFRFPERNVLAFSRDGRSIVYNTTAGVYLRSMDEREARLIPGTEEPLTGLEFSPDGQSIVFVTPGDVLNRMSISGGNPIELDRFNGGIGISYDSSESIIYATADGIYRVSPDGGPSERIVPPTPGEFISSLRLLPDSDSLLISMRRSDSAGEAQVLVRSISTGERTVLVSSGADARYLPSGHLIYAVDDGLYAVAFDLETLSVSGLPVQVAQGVMRSSAPGGSANYGVSDDGTLVYMSGGSTADLRRLVWVDREGKEDPIAAPPGEYRSPRLSPDGTAVALAVGGQAQSFEIWTWDLVRETSTRLTFEPEADRWPVWSPDGLRIAYQAVESDNQILVWRPANGSGTRELIAESSEQIFPTSFLPDGTGIFVFGELPRSNFNDDVAVVPLDGSGEINMLLDSPAFEAMAEISPDGRWLAYVSNESGDEEIYVQPYPEVGAGKWEISRGHGTEPLWARSGEELFFRRDGAVMAVRIQTEPVFSVGNPQVVIEGPFLQDLLGGRSYDLSPDGERFLMLATSTDESAARQIVIVQNWIEELKRLVPTE